VFVQEREDKREIKRGSRTERERARERERERADNTIKAPIKSTKQREREKQAERDRKRGGKDYNFKALCNCPKKHACMRSHSHVKRVSALLARCGHVHSPVVVSHWLYTAGMRTCMCG